MRFCLFFFTHGQDVCQQQSRGKRNAAGRRPRWNRRSRGAFFFLQKPHTLLRLARRKRAGARKTKRQPPPILFAVSGLFSLFCLVGEKEGKNEKENIDKGEHALAESVPLGAEREKKKKKGRDRGRSTVHLMYGSLCRHGFVKTIGRVGLPPTEARTLQKKKTILTSTARPRRCAHLPAFRAVFFLHL